MMDSLNGSLVSEKFFERGSIESGLTFIPTTAFFLLLVQFITAGSFQLVEKFELQNIVTRQGLGERLDQIYLGNYDLAEANTDTRELDLESKALPGGGEIVIIKSNADAPRVTDIFKVDLKMKTEAIAVKE